MKNLCRADNVIRAWMKAPAFRKEYEARKAEYALAGAIIEARQKAKLSQAALARRMKTTQPMIARMEGGRQPPSIATLLKFAKATKTRLEVRFVEA